MNDLQAVFSQINDIEGAIASVERNSAPGTEFAQKLALKSLRARRAEFEAMAEELSQRQLVDICDYRIIPDRNNRFPVKAVSGALGSFQDMFTAFFSAQRENRPRHKAIFDQDTIDASTLNVGYAYSGSLGVVLYVPSDVLLPMESDQDAAISAIFALAGQRTATGVRSIAEKYGRAPVRRFFEWSKFHIDYDLAADVKWKRGQETKEERLFQPEEFVVVNSLIEAASEYAETTEVLEGVLVALDVTRHSFKMSFPEARDIGGKFDETFNWKMPHEIPGRYRATVRKRVTQQLWSEVETVAWALIDLQELK